MQSQNPHEQWLLKSKSDLLSAKKLGTGEPVLLDTAVYHCQQSAEKSLKAFLVFKGAEFPKTHDLTFLNKIVMKIDIEFEQLIEACEYITPFSVEYRYPDETMSPSVEEFDKAFALTVEIYNFISNKLHLTLF